MSDNNGEVKDAVHDARELCQMIRASKTLQTWAVVMIECYVAFVVAQSIVP